MRILWEACIRVPSFPKASEACVAVLHRVADSEESIQDLVGKVFHGLWFASKREGQNLPSPLASTLQCQNLSCMPAFPFWGASLPAFLEDRRSGSINPCSMKPLNAELRQ